MSTAQAVAERQDNAPAKIEQHPADMLAMIERMAINPNIDTDKLERLIAMKKDMDATAARIAYNAALVKMLPDLPAIEKKGTSNNGAYGKWEDIQDAILPVLARHGFFLSFKTATTADSITVTAILRHEAGHDDSTGLTLPADKSGSKNNVQAVGSSVSYGKRYTASALLNLRIGGEDDDGSAAGTDAISEEQLLALNDLIEAAIGEIGGTAPKVFRPNMLKHLKVTSLDKLPAAHYARAVEAINSTRPKK